MSKLYDFTRLVRKYSGPIEIITYGNGEYVDGKYVKGEAKIIETEGAVVPMPQRKIYQSGGTLKTTDRQLYMLKEIPRPLDGAEVKHKGKTYSVEEDTDYTDYGDVTVYVLKWVEPK